MGSQARTHEIKAFVLDALIPGVDLILGQDWLAKNKVKLDFENMTCTVNGQSHTPIQSKKDQAGPTPEEKLQKGAKGTLLLVRENEEGRVSITSEQDGTPVYISTAQADPTMVPKDQLDAILTEYKDVFAEPTELPPDRGLGHVIPIIPGSKAPSRGIYRMSPKELDALKLWVADMIKKGYIVPSKSPFGAPVMFVEKQDGSLRLVVDYRATNAVTVKNTAPLPRIDALLDKMNGKTIFSSMDLQSGYYQIRIDEADCHKTAFNSPLGHYEFKVLPMGITNAPATFQAVMNMIFGHFDYVLVYLDE